MEFQVNNPLYVDIMETTIYNRKEYYDVVCKVHFYNDAEKTILNTAQEVKLDNLAPNEISFEGIIQMVISKLTN